MADRLLDKIRGPWAPGVKVTDCWLFEARWRSAWGYGRITEGPAGGRCLLAHREMARLSLPNFDPGLVVRHSCDQPLCCNPLHLEMGTQLENLRDQIRRKRRRLRRRSDNARWSAIFRMPDPTDYETAEA